MSKHIDLAKKLKALADKGVGGEKVNAEKMLNNLLKKHNITIEEIEGEKLNDYFFKLVKGEQQLWYQIVKRVNDSIKCYGSFPVSKVKQLGLKGNYMISCTASEYIEIESMYAIYKRLYQKELDIFFTAFCSANDLLLTAKEGDEKELTAEQLEEYERACNMAKNITKETYRKQIEA